MRTEIVLYIADSDTGRYREQKRVQCSVSMDILGSNPKKPSSQSYTPA